MRLNRDAVSLQLRAKTESIHIGEKRGTIRTHWNADCLLEDFSGKNYENIVN